MNEQIAPDTPTAIVVSLAKRVMLLQPMAGRFDKLPMIDPMQRLKILGEVVVEAAGESDHIRDMVVKNRYIENVRLVARERMDAAVEMPQLKPDLLGQRPTLQESS